MQKTNNISNKQKVVALLNSIETKDAAPIGYINPNKYVQHNLSIPDGLSGFGAVLQNAPKEGFKVKVIRAMQDGAYVFTQTDYDFFGPKIGFDIFKFENDLIVEHWDNLAIKAAKNPSGRTQIDGSTKIEDINKTKENKALVADFVSTILIKGEMNKLTNYFDGDKYIQHNSNIADGLSGLGKAFEAMAKQKISMVYNTNHLVLGEGNFVLSISDGKFADQDTTYYDLFRIENNKIVEHWDVMETMISKSGWKNNNGKFNF